MDRKIYFKEAKDAKNLVELINNGYSVKNHVNPSIGVYFVATYSDEDCTVSECHRRARRSFEDLLVIANTYFPNTTEEELMLALIEADMKYYYCSEICKIIFHRVTGSRSLNDGFDNLPDYVLQEGTYTIEQLKDIFNKVKLNK